MRALPVGRVDLLVLELLAAPGLVSAKYHEAAIGGGEAVVLPLSIAFPWLGHLPLLPPIRVPGQVL
jgi:hypothetical protein